MKLARYMAWAFLAVVISLVLIDSMAETAFGQVLYGSVVGTLSDATGAVVPSATVTVTNQATGLSRQAVTDQNGYYSIPNLLEGVYDLSVTAGGLKPYTQKSVTVSINRATRADAVLDVGAGTESVSVEATSAVLQTNKADVSTTLDTRAMENLPLSGYRN